MIKPNISVSRRYDVGLHQKNENDDDDDDSFDHDYFPNGDSLSSFVENVIVYVAGYVVQAVKSEVSCPSCQLALTCNVLDDSLRLDFGLIEQKDRGGLMRPSDDVIAVCK